MIPQPPSPADALLHALADDQTGIGAVTSTQLQGALEAQIQENALLREELQTLQQEMREQAELFSTMEILAKTGAWWRSPGVQADMARWSPGLRQITGQPEWAHIDFSRARSGIHPQDVPIFLEGRKLLDGSDIQFRWCRPDGQVRWLRTRMRRPSLKDGEQLELGVVMDVTDEMESQQLLNVQLDFIQGIASRLPGYIFQCRVVLGQEAQISYVSDAVRDLLKVEPEVLCQDFGELLSRVDARDRQRLLRAIERSVRTIQPFECEYRVIWPDASEHWHHTSAHPQDDGEGGVLLYGYTSDMTERKRSEEHVQQLAFYDPLTGLPNRRLLLERLRQAITRAQRRRFCGALLFIDLDNFKDLNDTLGHDTGDRLLCQVAQRLTLAVRESDSVARFGGDEFIVMLEELSEEKSEATQQATHVAKKLLAHLGAPYDLGHGMPYYSTPSIGIALFGPERKDVEELLKHADMAMYQAKASGRNAQCVFDPVMQDALHARASLESQLRQALENDQLTVFYQPVVDHHGHVQGVEALARWNHPQRGLVSPAEFIPLAEQTGLIVPLGRRVLQQAAQLLSRWASDPMTVDLTVAVNMSARQFRQPDFVNEVMLILHQAGARPQRLKIELTESMLLGEVESAIERMDALKRFGVGFSLDDFGTGYSSLSYLKRLPLDQVKIDRSFVRDVLTDPNDAAIVRTILALAQELELNVVAEGVETLGQMGFLRMHGCGQFQGYLFGRPVPEADIYGLLQVAA